MSDFSDGPCRENSYRPPEAGRVQGAQQEPPLRRMSPFTNQNMQRLQVGIQLYPQENIQKPLGAKKGEQMNLEVEYGKALGRLEEFRRNHQDQFCVQSQIMRHFWREAHVCCGQKEITNKHVKLICDAWQKRASRRALMTSNQKNCWTCAFNGTSAYYEPCNKCFLYGSDRQFDNWQPKKEEK